MKTDPPRPPELALDLPAGASATPPDDSFAAGLRGFGPIGILAILVILASNILLAPLGAVLALLWAQESRTPWRAIGYTRPGNWTLTVIGGVVLGVAFKLLMKAIVMPMLGAPPINQAYHYLAGNRDALPGAILTMIVVAGFGEETFYRGWMFERFGKLLGRGVGARIATVLITSVVFALVHYPVQGLAGSEQAMITGLVFGTLFMLTGRIWMVMIMHAAFDLTAVWMIYANLETWVAHWVFK